MTSPVRAISIAEEAAALASCLAGMVLPKHPIVVYGSSTVRLWPDVPAGLGRQDVVPVGFGGATLRDCHDNYDLLVRPLFPRLLVLAAGTNDIEKRNADAEEIVRLVGEITTAARRTQPALPIAVLTLKPAPYHGERMTAIRAGNALLAARLPAIGNATLIDTFSPFVNAAGEVDPGFYAADMRHLNAKGYETWNSAIKAGLPPPE
jgi:lysophospholipase L1-like esterase